jgi:hypothetical protein
MKRILLLCSAMMLLSVSAFSQSSTMTIREVFDFQPGDVFHYTKYYPSYQYAFFGAIRFEITSRTMSAGNDTVCYTEQHFDYDAEHQGTLYIDYSFHNYSKQVCYTHLDSMIHTLVDTAWLVKEPWMPFIDSTFLNQGFCNTLTYFYDAKYGGSFEPIYEKAAYGKGMGVTYYEYTDSWSFPSIYYGRKMIFAKKGSVPCGQPDNTTQEIVVAYKNPSGVLCYPNPATTHLTLEFDENLLHLHKEIRLSNTLGEVLQQESFGDGEETGLLDISHLPSGTYFLQISGEGVQPISRKFLKN